MDEERSHIHWLGGQSTADSASLVRLQVQQAVARIVLGLLGLAYLGIHAPLFRPMASTFLPFAAIYLLLNALAIPLIRRRPVSALRALLLPALDIAIVSFGMVLDGGHASGLYLVLLVIIFGNGFRYSNALMLYSQAGGVIGLVAVSIVSLSHLHLDIDRSLLVWQLLGLLVLPLYVFLIGRRAEHAQHRLKEAERASLQILDMGPAPVFAFETDSSGAPRIVYCNAATNAIYRDEWIKLIGEMPDVLTVPEDGQEMLLRCRETLSRKDGSPVVFYVRGRDKQDRILRLMCTASRLQWRGRTIGVCFVQNITRQEGAHNMMIEGEREGFMSTLIAGIVHDFRNVLTTIIGQAEVLELDIRDERLRKDAASIIQAAERGTAMIERLLAMVRRKNPPEQIVSGHELRDLLDNILGLIRLQIPAHVRFDVSIEDQLPDIRCEEVEIEQILLNLVLNAAQALEASEQGSIEVRIETDANHRLAQAGRPALILSVRDDGPGIRPDDLPNIFQPFWSQRADKGGSGLGLAMVQRIVRQHGGEIDVESEPGRGACFRIALPAAADDRSPEAKPTPAAAPEPDVRIEGLRVLVVDDDAGVLTVHRKMVERLGCVTEAMEDPQTALARIRSDPNAFDLLVTDFRMPRMNGLELLRAVREFLPELPVLLVTAWGEEDELRKARDMCVRILHKPVSIARLNEAIADAARCAQRARANPRADQSG
ncbi:MAG: ATP-binding protein [Mariprofundaceae bacterium]